MFEKHSKKKKKEKGKLVFIPVLQITSVHTAPFLPFVTLIQINV
jgi:hypothetical protein